MTHVQLAVEINTPGRGLHEVTDHVREAVSQSGIQTGLCVIFCMHTSCSLVISENADPSARQDLEVWLEKLAPDGDPAYSHRAEGPDDMPAHLRAAVTQASETIPIVNGAALLGRWQGLYLAEHRTAPHQRRLFLHLAGD